MATRRQPTPEEPERREDWAYPNMVPWGKNPADYGFVVRIVEITPALAAEWLKLNTRNRNFKAEKVRQYVEDIIDGKWEINGETIIFSWISSQDSWQLGDGQNRLKAVVDSGISIWSLVVFGPSFDQTLRTTGSGATRTSAEMLQIQGEDDPNVLSGAAAWQWRFDRGLMGASDHKKPTHSQTLDVLDKHPGLRNSVTASRPAQKATGIYPSIAAFLHYQFTLIDAGDADYFFDHLRSGTDPRTEDQRRHMEEDAHPIWVLREWLRKERWNTKTKRDRASRGFISRTQMGTMIKAWNLYMMGEPVHSVGRLVYKTASGSKASEKWPTVYNPLADEDA